MKERTENLLWFAVIAAIFAVGISDPFVWRWAFAYKYWILGVLLIILVSNACTAIVCDRRGERRGWAKGYEFGYSEGKK